MKKLLSLQVNLKKKIFVKTIINHNKMINIEVINKDGTTMLDDNNM